MYLSLSLFRACLYQLNHPIVRLKWFCLVVTFFRCVWLLLLYVVYEWERFLYFLLLLFLQRKQNIEFVCLFIVKYGLSGDERTSIRMCFLEKEKRERLNERETDHCPISHQMKRKKWDHHQGIKIQD